MSLVSESATLALNARAKQLAAEGKTIYNLTAGELATETPSYIQEAVAKTLHLNKYTPVAGLPELRQAIAEVAGNFYGLDWIEPENVVVAGGVKPALYTTLLAIINPGDEVIVPAPYWVSYRYLIELAGGVMIEAPLTDKFDLDPSAVEAKLSKKTKAVLLNSPHNPTGAVFSESALHRTAKILRDSEITVIADDIYSRLVYEDGFVPTPKCGFEKIIIINGFSKSQALTGWRIGYMIAGKPIAEAATSLLSHITGNASLPGQYAALEACRRGDLPPRETMASLERNRELVSKELAAIPSINFHTPGGAFYFFLDIRGVTTDSTSFCEQLLAETGVALVPGEAFGAPGFARLSFVAEETVLVRAMEQIKSFLSKRGNKT